MRWVVRLLVLAVFVALLVGGWQFASDNAELVRVNYVFGAFEGVKLWLALTCAFGAGAALALALSLAVGSLRGARLRLEARRYRRAARELESEVHQLRNLPLTEEGPVPPPPEPLAAAGSERGA